MVTDTGWNPVPARAIHRQVRRRSFLIGFAGAFAAGAAENGFPSSSGSADGAGFDKIRTIRVAHPESLSRPLHVLTWNIDRGTNFDEIASELGSAHPDLLLLQEVDANDARSGFRDVAAGLARRLKLNAVYGVEFEELSQERRGKAYIGQATLTRLPIRNSRLLRFSHQSNFWRPRPWLPSNLPWMQRRLGSRIALVTELTYGGRLCAVYNAHLESRSYGRIQMDQLEEILADARRYPPGTPVILAGDLNTKYLPSIFLHKLEQAGFISALGSRIERTHSIAMSLDWIFARGPVDFDSARVDRTMNGSDHYPIYAGLRLRR